MGTANTFWEVEITCNNYVAQKECTWADVKACANELGKSSGEVFTCLHRAEGGFMCVCGPNFYSTESAEGVMPLCAPVVRKAIRFNCHTRIDWPSWNCSFDGAHDDDVVFGVTGNFIQLRFEGQNCTKWTKAEAKQYANTIATSMGWKHVHKNTNQRSSLLALREDQKDFLQRKKRLLSTKSLSLHAEGALGVP